MSNPPLLNRAGATIFTEEDDHRYVYRLRSGWAARSRTLSDGRRQLIALFLAGDLFGLKAIMLERQPDAIVCLSDVSVDRLEYRPAMDLFMQDSSIAARIAFQLMEDERRLHNWSIGLGRGRAEERLSLMFVELYGRLSRLQLVRPDGSFAVPMTQRDMGDRVGLTIVHVNRVLRRFREDGLLKMTKGRATVLDMGKLVRLARPLLDVFERSAPEYNGAEREPPSPVSVT